MSDIFRETSIERVTGNNSWTTVYTGEVRFINALKKLKEEYPDEVNITAVNDDGSMLARVPFDWMRFVAPKRHREMTDEQRAAAAERMKKAREKK